MTSILETAGELLRRGEPFLFATVVWRRSPSSGHQGSKAIIHADGRMTGWIGGACAEPAVIKEALRALEDGEPRLMYLGPADELEGQSRPGVRALPIACASEGAMEVYVEPMLPLPHLVVIGRSPGVAALVAMAGTLGWRTTVVDEGGDPGQYPTAGAVVTALDLSHVSIDRRTCIVVATQGHYDEAALEAALATDAGYVGLVASQNRADTVLGYLRDRGVDAAALARIKTPAGLDLGPIEHEEIGIAVLGELISLKAAGDLPSGVSPVEQQEEAVDPVCGMSVPVASARFRSEHEGRTYYFCSAGCQASFEEDPAQYVAVGT